jgi:hypothetical protein
MHVDRKKNAFLTLLICYFRDVVVLGPVGKCRWWPGKQTKISGRYNIVIILLQIAVIRII